MSSIMIKIEPGGKTTTEVKGAPGNACSLASKPYDNIFAGNVVSDVPTEEAKQPEVHTTQQQKEQQNQ